MGLPRWEVAGDEMGRRIYHSRGDVQDGKWQVMRWEDEFTTGDGTFKMGSGMRWDFQEKVCCDGRIEPRCFLHHAWWASCLQPWTMVPSSAPALMRPAHNTGCITFGLHVPRKSDLGGPLQWPMMSWCWIASGWDSWMGDIEHARELCWQR